MERFPRGFPLPTAQIQVTIIPFQIKTLIKGQMSLREVIMKFELSL